MSEVVSGLVSIIIEQYLLMLKHINDNNFANDNYYCL